jgi:hypothetical protein
MLPCRATDTPENAAAETRYLKSRGYPIERIEMGEEPMGSLSLNTSPLLYLQFEKAIHKIIRASAWRAESAGHRTVTGSGSN